jgi:hypothetical protein
MKIQQVADRPKLFAIQDICSREMLSMIHNINWSEIPFSRDIAHRRLLDESTEVQKAVNQAIRDMAPLINQCIGYNYCQGWIYVDWLLCEPGYISPPHTDGSKANTMILYWKSPGEDFGTEFYTDPSCQKILHSFLSIDNTGFFTVYDQDPNFNWHGSMRPVPEAQYRLITSCFFQR